MTPYIGITNFTSGQQVNKMMAVLAEHLPQHLTHQLHVGVMMSWKTLHGIPSRWSQVFPAKERLAGIFWSSLAYNCLHYADMDNNPGLANSLTEALSWCGDTIHAIQLDMIWPDPQEIAKGVEASGKNVEVILQLGNAALAAVGNDPQQLVQRLTDYAGVIDRVLLDKSMGRGLPMDTQALLPFALAIRQQLPHIGIGVAGGLGPKTVHIAQPIIKAIPQVSLDAQGQLCLNGNALNPIDWGMAAAYITQACQLFSPPPPAVERPNRPIYRS